MAEGEQATSGWIGGWKARRTRRDAAHALYLEVVASGRAPVLYAEWGVPDTVDGRFEMIGLHAALLMRRLAGAGPRGPSLGQALFDVMFADLDRSLRELGVGDLSVGKKVKAIAESFYGRADALERGMAAGDRQAVVGLLARNVYQTGQKPTDAQLEALADHLARYARHLEATPTAELLHGRLPAFPPLVVDPDPTAT
jgi:cytochrome b pre-mRNA-processing protein 3